MGVRGAKAAFRRASGMVAGLATVSALLVVAAPAAHALVSCVPPGTGADPCPAALDDDYATTFNVKLTVPASLGVLKNDKGPAGTKVVVADSDKTSWNDAAVNLNTDGGFSYTPNKSFPFSGVDSFDYTISDNDGNEDFATAYIQVNPVPKADAYTLLVNHTLNVAAPGVFQNDLGLDPDTVEYDATSAKGVSIIDNDSGAFSYTPAHGFIGTDSFHYKALDLDWDSEYTITVTIKVVATPPPPPPPPGKPKGYWMVGATGHVYPFGQVKNYGNATSARATHIEPTPSKKGYWVVDAQGSVFAFGDAKGYGKTPKLRDGETATSLSATPSGKGYWIFTNRGRVFARGDAKSFGDMSGVPLNGPIVGSATTPTGNGYYMVASDGGIFAFGGAKFFGSMGGAHLNKPVNGLVPTANNKGYWLVASDGGIFAFGNARFHGSMGSTKLNRPVIGMVRYGDGYLMVSSDGGIFAFSNLAFFGSLGSNPPASPIVGVAPGG